MNNLSNDEMRAHIFELLAKKRDYRQEVKDLVSQYKFVVFYGCGAIFHGIASSWEKHIGVKIDFCCDSDSTKWGKMFRGIQCISPVELKNMKNECAVYVTIGDFQPIFRMLTDNGFPAVNVVSKNALDIASYITSCQQDEISSNLFRAYEMLSDDQSRKVFSAVVHHVLDAESNPNTMLNVCEADQYFPYDVMELSQHERLVDIGAYNGDTIRDFVNRTEGKFDQIFSFEVDSINFNALQNNVSKMPERDRIKIFNLGIWDTEREITYSIGESESTVGVAGEGIGHVVPLDNVLKDERVTIIKMDIEGAEPQALHGARNIIQAQKPKLSICVYHDFRHLWEIPFYIKSLAPEYRIYLRHHTNLEYETVCYAII
jgi:FkbM family methyltransferase